MKKRSISFYIDNTLVRTRLSRVLTTQFKAFGYWRKYGAFVVSSQLVSLHLQIGDEINATFPLLSLNLN